MSDPGDPQGWPGTALGLTTDQTDYAASSTLE
jgi:hypothetical protein